MRAALRVSLQPGVPETGPVLRGRVIGWPEEALSVLPDDGSSRHWPAVTIRAANGIEAFVWLVDVAGMPRDDAAETLSGPGRPCCGRRSLMGCTLIGLDLLPRLQHLHFRNFKRLAG